MFALAVVCISAFGLEVQARARWLPGRWLGALPRHHQGIKMEASWGLLYLFFFHIRDTNFCPLLCRCEHTEGEQLNINAVV